MVQFEMEQGEKKKREESMDYGSRVQDKEEREERTEGLLQGRELLQAN